MLINHTASTVQVRYNIAGIIFPGCALAGEFGCDSYVYRISRISPGGLSRAPQPLDSVRNKHSPSGELCCFTWPLITAQGERENDPRHTPTDIPLVVQECVQAIRYFSAKISLGV